MALSLPPRRATIFENSPGGISPVPLNIRCSRKCGRPDLPGGLSAVPTLYQTQWATTGRAMVLDHHHLHAVVEGEGLGVEDAGRGRARDEVQPRTRGAGRMAEPAHDRLRYCGMGWLPVRWVITPPGRAACSRRCLGHRVEHIGLRPHRPALEIQDEQEPALVQVDQLGILLARIWRMPGSAWTCAARQQQPLALALAASRSARAAGRSGSPRPGPRCPASTGPGAPGAGGRRLIVGRQDQRRAADHLELVGRPLAEAQIFLNRAGAAGERRRPGAPARAPVRNLPDLDHPSPRPNLVLVCDSTRLSSRIRPARRSTMALSATLNAGQ